MPCLSQDAQGDLKFIQNPIMREGQKFGEHEQASSHLYFCEIFEPNAIFTCIIKKNGTIRYPHCNAFDLDIIAVWFLIF